MGISFMNIGINSFIEFPGILITIGVILLIISIILIIIAYRSMEKTEPIIEESDNIVNQPSIKNESNIDNKDKELDNTVVTDDKNNESIENSFIGQDNKLENESEKHDNEESEEDEGFDLTKVFEISPLKDNETFDLKDDLNSVVEEDVEDIELL